VSTNGDGHHGPAEDVFPSTLEEWKWTMLALVRVAGAGLVALAAHREVLAAGLPLGPDDPFDAARMMIGAVLAQKGGGAWVPDEHIREAVYSLIDTLDDGQEIAHDPAHHEPDGGRTGHPP